ncbi:Putative uncharacterized protein [Taphrina deformans PYCC 5710]|uniref:Fms interacting protein n=1 Tax=Taphrina deformans (strain PYCC 5710 / ATCC 11124 / CBS 356.35 / IMI 108563 / JCM 9778 / NBRC 8474) TaxID=1097556 RepID=R4XEE9_TAPDE|nr:Putative uncharacterized protein [Taphrina deformans PYCC 5710]|eukprot:CCG82851.1 Putative uncharacterized protein [Taphrina deformans PYCC 5710]
MAQQISAELRQQTLETLQTLGETPADEKMILQQSHLLAKLVQLRAANRVMWQGSKLAKAKTTEAKTEIDRLNLGLQGLYYEQRHLRNEINTCKETPTIYHEIALLPEHEFLEINQSAQELSGRDLMLARLAHEKEERLQLEALKKDLVAKKSALIAENKRRKGELESLEGQLQAFVAAAENIQSSFKKY